MFYSDNYNDDVFYFINYKVMKTSDFQVPEPHVYSCIMQRMVTDLFKFFFNFYNKFISQPWFLCFIPFESLLNINYSFRLQNQLKAHLGLLLPVMKSFASCQL